MAKRDLHLITGAFGYSGQHLARRLLRQGKRVATITGHPDRPNPFGDEVVAHRMDFEDRDGLRRAMEGVAVFYNTYWVRFAYGETTHQKAVRNTQALIDAAVDAGVERFVHVPKTVLFMAARVMGRIVGDVVLTWDEIAGLSADLLVSARPPTGSTRLTTWLDRHATELGREYANEVRRHYR